MFVRQRCLGVFRLTVISRQQQLPLYSRWTEWQGRQGNLVWEGMLNFLDRKPRPRPVQPSTVESFFFVNISPLYFLVQLAVNEKTYPNICHYILLKKSIYSNQYTHVECALTPPAPKKNKTLYKSKNARNASLLYTETCIKLLRLKVLRFTN